MRSRSRALYASPTRVTFTQTTVDRRIDRLWLRVQLRAAELGITQVEVARRMGIKSPRLVAICSAPSITRRMFERLDEALSGDQRTGELAAWWTDPLPKVPRISREKMLAKVRAKIG